MDWRMTANVKTCALSGGNSEHRVGRSGIVLIQLSIVIAGVLAMIAQHQDSIPSHFCSNFEEIL